MNDFTKEELQDIYDTYQWMCDEYREPDSTYRLKDKIQSMIDNYCEHELEKTLAKSGMNFNFQCKKCRKIMNVLTGQLYDN